MHVRKHMPNKLRACRAGGGGEHPGPTYLSTAVDVAGHQNPTHACGWLGRKSRKRRVMIVRTCVAR
jgi:hypothetical protein